MASMEDFKTSCICYVLDTNMEYMIALLDPRRRLAKRGLETHRSNQKGLTLIEIIVVLMLVGIIGSFVTGRVFSAGDKAKAQLTKTKMTQMQGDINMYQLGNNSLPSNMAAADVGDATDAWGRDVSYRITNGGRSYELKSLGADGKDGGTGGNADITVTGP
jgi:general secretion pathway protein G